MSTLLMFLGVILLVILDIVLHLHGIMLAFKKKWYIGVIAIVVPFFALIVSLAKILFKKDILAE